MIIDVHSHAWAYPEHFSEDFRQQARRARAGAEVDLSVRFDEYQRAASEPVRTIVFGGKARLSGLWVEDNYVAEYVAAHSDRLIGFLSLDPTQPGWEEELRFGHQELKLRGIKLMPMYGGYRPDEPRLDALWGYAERHRLPVLLHTGTTFVAQAPLECTLPRHLDPVATRFPEVRIIMAHLGHPYEGECIVTARKHPHVYADISALHYRPWQFYNSLMLVQEYGVWDKVLFGTDYPFTNVDATLAGLRGLNQMLAGTALPRLSEEAMEQMIYREALPLLGIEQMRITDVEPILLRGEESYCASEGSREAVDNGDWQLLVRVSTDEGLVGWSDVETLASAALACINGPGMSILGFRSLKELLIGEEPLSDPEGLWTKLYIGTSYYGRRGVALHCISAIDNCLWSIRAQAAGAALVDLIGGRKCGRVTAYASTLFRETPEAMIAAAQGYVEQGFRAVKFGWGVFGEDRVRDLELVAAAREALGPERELMVDPGWYGAGWKGPWKLRTLDDNIELCQSLAPYRVRWIEDFIHPELFDDYAAVRRESPAPLAAGEQLGTIWDFERLIRGGCVDVVQPDLTRCGGITVAMQIARLANEAKIDLVPHSWLTDLLTAYSLHLIGTLARPQFVEFNVSQSALTRGVCGGALSLNADGTVTIPSGVGLGVEVDEEFVAARRVN